MEFTIPSDADVGTFTALLADLSQHLEIHSHGPIEPPTLSVVATPGSLGSVSAPPAIREAHLRYARASAVVLPGRDFCVTLSLAETYPEQADPDALTHAIRAAIRHLHAHAFLICERKSIRRPITYACRVSSESNSIELVVSVPGDLELGAGWRVEVRDLALGNAPLLPGAQRANVGVFHELRPPGAVFAAALTGTRADMLDALAAGGSTGESRRGNFTCLHAAARNLRSDIVSALIEVGAPVNQPGCDFDTERHLTSRTPLSYALFEEARNVGARSSATSDALLRAPGIDVNMPSGNGQTPLLELIGRSPHCHETWQRLLAAPGMNPNAFGDADQAPLLMAVNTRNIAAVSELLASPTLDVNIRERGQCRRASLHYAAVHDSSELMQPLLRAPGVDVNIRDVHGMAPLHIAAQHGSGGGEALLALLAAPGVDVNARDVRGQSPLHYACGGCAPAVAALLAAPGLDINARDAGGESVCRNGGCFLRAHSLPSL